MVKTLLNRSRSAKNCNKDIASRIYVSKLTKNVKFKRFGKKGKKISKSDNQNAGRQKQK